ncbi:hypothetical protein RvY_04655 [Ramazzottius varieornatus]|uniref:G-protein coupled receptors family 1 profile domain-containing protein n=1 Tax=Ramazzottius varieornatus TaxID=947166 RepID=A0A1D1V2A8_RAMVA|nr:hypothetical protein RvY_04655 [Ramazzottius varieornatus]
MASSDFLVGAVCMPFSLIYEYYQYWPLNETICSFYMYFDYTAANVSVWTLVVIAVDRFWAVQWPTTYHRHNKISKALIGVLLSWLAVNATVLPGYIYTRIIFGWLTEKEKRCAWEHDGLSSLASSFPTSVINGWLPTPIVLVCYMVIVIKVHKIGYFAQPMPAGPTRHNASNRRRQERQAFLVLTLLVVAQVALWMPWMAYLMRKHLLQYETSEVYVTVAYWLGYSLSAVNPILLMIGNRDICHAVRRVFGLRARQRVAAESRGTRMTRYLAPADPGDQGIRS